MNWFYDLKIARKLALGFGLCLVLSCVIGVVAVARMAQMNKISGLIISDPLDGVEYLATFQGAAKQFRLVEYRLLLDSPDKDAANKAEMAKCQADAEQALAGYQKTAVSPDDKKNIDRLQADWQRYEAMTPDFADLSDKNLNTQATALIDGTMNDQAYRVWGDMDTMMSWNQKHGVQYSQQAQSAYATARALIVGLLALAVALGAGAGVVITRYMTGTLAQVSGRLEKLSRLCITNFAGAIESMEQGDLAAQIVTGTDALDIHTRDEFGGMAATFNAMLDQVQSTIGSFRKSQGSLAGLVGGLQDSSAWVASASGTLSATAQQVGASSEEITATMQAVASASEQSARGASEIAQSGTTQAAALAQGSALVKQLSESIHGVARDSQAATQAAADATAVAGEGAQTVSQSVQSMQNIHRTVSESAQVVQTLGEASRQIGGIVQTIDEIAEQTNLLALNAAIEAARAGDAGRGFAVVADEVRKLAERSAAATREISSLINDVQTRTERAVASMQTGTAEVQNGRELAERAGEALARIQSVVQTVTARVNGIQEATSEMTTASDEVAKAITEVAAVVEESSAAAEEMSASAEQVSASVQTVAGTVAQQSNAVEELGASAMSLSEIAQRLEAVTARFRVSDSGAPAQSQRPALSLLRAA